MIVSEIIRDNISYERAPELVCRWKMETKVTLCGAMLPWSVGQKSGD